MAARTRGLSKRAATGTVALVEEGTRWADSPGWMSDHHGQFGECVGESSGRRHVGAEIEEAAAEVLDEGMPGDDHFGRTVSLQPSHGSESGLEASVVGLQRVVRMDLRAMECGRQQLVEDAGVDAVPVGRDLHRLHPVAIDRLGEELSCWHCCVGRY